MSDGAVRVVLSTIHSFRTTKATFYVFAPYWFYTNYVIAEMCWNLNVLFTVTIIAFKQAYPSFADFTFSNIFGKIEKS